jgi:hypothetical protein
LAVFGANEAAQMTVKTDSDWVFNRGKFSTFFSDVPRESFPRM